MKPSTHLRPQGSNAVKPGLTRPLTSEERRRAQRVLLRVPIRVKIAGKAEAVEGATHTVSAAGALVVLGESLPQGTKISIENITTQKKVEAHIPRPPQYSSEGALVPVEFDAPAPNFWNVFFPPVLN
jgi:PilZ domain-containing protein